MSSSNSIINNDVKILLLRPPLIAPTMAHTIALCPPLGIAYLAGHLKISGFNNVFAIDAIGEAVHQRFKVKNGKFLHYGLTIEQISQKIKDQYSFIDILAVSVMFSHEWPMAKSLISQLKKDHPQVFIICGGEHITAAPEFCLQECPEINLCALGEGEETITDIAKTFLGEKNWDSIPGIVFKNSNGKIQRTIVRKRIKDINQIPWPDWNILPIEQYLSNYLGYGIQNGRSMPMLATRGCPFECTFCSNPTMWTTRWISRNVNDVIKEMEHYINIHHVSNFDFYDLTAIIRKDWLHDFCNSILNKGWNITWQIPAGTRSEALDGDILKLMYQSGSRNLTYAPESGSPSILKKIKKKIHLDTMKISMKSAVKIGINVKANMIFGFPDETRKEIFQTFKFIISLAWIGVHDIYIACFSPYPGSELYEELAENKQIKYMDEQYFLDLMTYSDLSFSRSYSKYVGDKELLFYRLFGMMMFYILSYSLRPWRFFITIFNLMRKKEESRLEMALNQIIWKHRRFIKTSQTYQKPQPELSF